MSQILDRWEYSDRVSEKRRINHADPGSFAKMVQLVLDDAFVVEVRTKPGRSSGLTHCKQPIFALELNQSGDAFFNGPFGYRAQYLVGPASGLAANATVLSELTPKLLAAIDLNADPELAKIDVCQSLAAASAKIWINESESASIFANPTRDLAIARWITEADNGVELASWGLCAPMASKFEVKGALLDPYGNEVVSAQKVRRHFDIFHYGFS